MPHAGPDDHSVRPAEPAALRGHRPLHGPAQLQAGGWMVGWCYSWCYSWCQAVRLACFGCDGCGPALALLPCHCCLQPMLARSNHTGVAPPPHQMASPHNPRLPALATFPGRPPAWTGWTACCKTCCWAAAAAGPAFSSGTLACVVAVAVLLAKPRRCSRLANG